MCFHPKWARSAASYSSHSWSCLPSTNPTSSSIERDYSSSKRQSGMFSTRVTLLEESRAWILRSGCSIRLILRRCRMLIRRTEELKLAQISGSQMIKDISVTKELSLKYQMQLWWARHDRKLRKILENQKWSRLDHKVVSALVSLCQSVWLACIRAVWSARKGTKNSCWYREMRRLSWYSVQNGRRDNAVFWRQVDVALV